MLNKWSHHRRLGKMKSGRFNSGYQHFERHSEQQPIHNTHSNTNTNGGDNDGGGGQGTSGSRYGTFDCQVTST